MKTRLVALFALAVLAIATGASGVAQTAPSQSTTPPPPPLPNTNRTEAPVLVPIGPGTATPGPAPTITSPVTAPPSPDAGRRGRKGAPPPSGSPAPGATPVDTPAPPQFATLDGTWEVQLQTRTKTYYSHFVLKQSADAASITGSWNRDNKKLPLTGTFDGRLFKFSVKDGASEYALSGYAENYSDLIGLAVNGTTSTAFTASHRKREKTF